MTSRLEINFCRLLKRCELMIRDNKLDDWRLEKYVCRLQDQLAELRQAETSKPAAELLADYTKKVEFIRGLLEADKKDSASDKALAAMMLPPGGLTTNQASEQTKELHIKAKSLYHGAMRDELFNKRNTDSSPDSSSDVRQRKTDHSGDIDALLQHHHHVQERIAEEMVALARGMKETAQSANDIIKKDNMRLQESNTLADTNYSKLKVESERLERHTKKSCNYWLWIMLGLVCLTFMWMIIFMKMFPKKR